MAKEGENQQSPRDELIELKNRLEETEETLRAIRNYMVDAFVITRHDGSQVVTLSDADFPYRLMVEAMNEGAVTLIPDGTVFYSNPCFSRMVQIESNEIIGRHFADLIERSQRERFTELLKQASNNATRGQFLLNKSQGGHIPVQLSMYRLNGEASGISILVTDLSEHIENEKKIYSLASDLTIAEHDERFRISQLLHDDLQQNLYAIKAQLSTIDPAGTSDQIQAKLMQADQLLTNAIALTRNLSTDISPSVLQSDSLTQSILWLCARMKEQYGLHVRARASDQLVNLSDHMRVLLFQTVRELLFNIIKHAGTLEAMVTLERTERLGRITITDAGKGFDPNTITVDPMDSHGLSLQQDRLKLMHGSLSIHTKPGEGTTVVVEFPVDEDPT